LKWDGGRRDTTRICGTTVCRAVFEVILRCDLIAGVPHVTSSVAVTLYIAADGSSSIFVFISKAYFDTRYNKQFLSLTLLKYRILV
jgi:hypothetical protein